MEPLKDTKEKSDLSFLREISTWWQCRDQTEVGQGPTWGDERECGWGLGQGRLW